MAEVFRPLLAADASKVKLKFPLLVSPKLDGIRCVVRGGKAMSRSMKPIPNRFVRKCIELEEAIFETDGELMVGDEFNSTTSGIMTHAGNPDFRFHLFDIIGTAPFEERFQKLNEIVLPEFCKIVEHKMIRSDSELESYYEEILAKGFEGIMLRDPRGRYKQGRSTEKEGILFKLKPFEDSEGVVIGFEELQHNDNEQKIDELGYSKRSTEKDGKRAGGTLGKFILKGLEGDWKDVEFRVGTGIGLTFGMRSEIWGNQEKYLGKIVKFKYQKIGSIDKPRIPIFLGFRNQGDM